ncbi:hypothetical protein ES695_05160 [Candidatus Atribacteria bacterium 1244-E10-H5-B2]|nr:MAG: hypothetical protein ES695_05160 [Candidatus Atribacteria bacterium 1244-E10-H5-B2]
MVKQTVVKKENSIRFGSGKFEVSNDDWATSKDLGAMRNVIFEETWDALIVDSDNAGEVQEGIRNQKAALVGDLMELDLEKLNIMRGGIDVFTEPAGTPVTDYSQVVLMGSWLFNVFIPFDKQNGDGSKITPTPVTGSVDGALELNVDYDIVKDSSGRWGITITERTGEEPSWIGKVTTEAQNVTIVYDYTPSAHKLLTSGGLFKMTPAQARITNVNEAGKNLVITLFKANSVNGITIALQPDEGEDAAVCPIRIEGTRKPDLPAGEQLFKIEDFQNV